MQVKCLARSRCSKKASAIILVTVASILSKVRGLMKDSEKDWETWELTGTNEAEPKE